MDSITKKSWNYLALLENSVVAKKFFFLICDINIIKIIKLKIILILNIITVSEQKIKLIIIQLIL